MAWSDASILAASARPITCAHARPATVRRPSSTLRSPPGHVNFNVAAGGVNPSAARAAGSMDAGSMARVVCSAALTSITSRIDAGSAGCANGDSWTHPVALRTKTIGSSLLRVSSMRSICSSGISSAAKSEARAERSADASLCPRTDHQPITASNAVTASM